MAEKQETIHLRRFDGGKRTPEEVHRELGLGNKRCSFCDDPAAIRGMVYADADEYARRDPEGYFALVRKAGGDPAFDSRWGRIIRTQDMYGCDRCKQSLKLALARKPDWMFVDFDEMGLSSSHPAQVQSAGVE
jgi:hypothetical protein